MKKLFLGLAIAASSLTFAQSGLKLGANVGLPIGDAGDLYSFTAGIDAAYLWPVAAEFNVGVATGFQSYFLKSEWKDRGIDNLNIIPIAASGQYKLTPQFSLGVDLGYAFVLNEDADGGFYYAPRAAYHFGPSEVNLSYRGISQDGSNRGSINLGYAYTFGK